MVRRPNRIAVLSFHTSPLALLGGTKAGGMNYYVRSIAAQLGAEDVAVDVFTRRDDTSTPEVLDLAPAARLIHIDAGPPIQLDAESAFHYTSEFASEVSLFAQNNDFQYDLIHSHYWLSVLAGESLAVEWDVPHLAMFHTLGEVKLRARASERESAARLESERRLVHSVDGIIAATHHERQLLRQVFRVSPGQVSVVPLGVDLNQFQPRDQVAARIELGRPKEEKLLLAVGRIEPLKGFDILIRALAEMTHTEQVTLVVIGGDEQAASEFSRLRSVADEVGVFDRVEFPGAIHHERLADYYNAADVVVIPSFYESFGLVALEAMASGVPVVASRVGGLTSTVADGRSGYLVPWRCPEPFAEKIDLLLSNDELRRALGVSGVESVQRYSWQKVASTLLSIYEDILTQGSLLQETHKDGRERAVVVGRD